jgi:hypothetical protein
MTHPTQHSPIRDLEEVLTFLTRVAVDWLLSVHCQVFLVKEQKFYPCSFRLRLYFRRSAGPIFHGVECSPITVQTYAN